MKKANTSNISQTITLVEQKVTTKAKRTLYLVLKRKGFADEIVEYIDYKLEKIFYSLCIQKFFLF